MRVTDPPAWNEPSAFEFEYRGTSLRLTYHGDILRTRSDKNLQRGGKGAGGDMNEEHRGICELTSDSQLRIVLAKFAEPRVLIITNSTKVRFNQFKHGTLLLHH